MARSRNASFNAVVGRKRIAPSLNAYTRSAQLNVRAQMSSVINNYRKFISQVEEAMPDVLYEALQPTYELSQEYVPYDTGALADSGYLEITNFRGKPRVEIGYGLGGVPPYAVRVHETMEFRHEAPTRAKWLQVALEEDAPNVQKRIVDALKI